MRLIKAVRCVFALRSSLIAGSASIMLAGCSDQPSISVAECDAQRELNKAVMLAMCTGWSEKREDALAHLVEAAANSNLRDVTNDYVRDIAADISSKDCVDAGFRDYGEKMIDLKAQERRNQMSKHKPPPSGEAPPTSYRLTNTSCKLH